MKMKDTFTIKPQVLCMVFFLRIWIEGYKLANGKIVDQTEIIKPVRYWVGLNYGSVIPVLTTHIKFLLQLS